MLREREFGDSFPQRAVRYKFGPFELMPGAVELRRQGVRVPLVGQPLRILLTLVQNPDRVVTREELRDALWPGDVHVAFDGALNTAIRKLRLSLEDSPADEKYIQTVPRAGYRFMAEVEAIEVTPPVTTLRVLPPPATPAPVLSRRWPSVAVAVLVVCALGATSFWWSSRRSVPASLINRAYLTSFPGEQTVPAISPDGGQVAFSWTDPEGDKVRSIYVTSINGLGLHRLTNAAFADFGPAWSPDGSLLAFVRETPDGADSIMVVSSSGGPVRRIAETDARFVAWVPGGTGLLAVHKLRGERNFQLSSVSLQTGERRAVTAPGEYMDAWERFGYSPDGSFLAYAQWSGKTGLPELYVRPAAGGKPRQVTWLNSHLHNWWCWLPDSRSMLIVTDEQGTRRLFRISIDHPQASPEPIGNAGDDLLYPAAVAADGKIRLVFCQQRLTGNLHHFSIRRDSRGIPVGLGAPRTIAPATRMSGNPEIAPDGHRLAFVSDRSLFAEIWLSEPDGRNPHALTSFASARIVPGSPQWSPDGRRVVFSAFNNDVTDLYLASADGSPAAQLTRQSFDVIRPSFSRDGKWIYFSKRDTTADPLQIWKIPARADAREKDALPLFGAGTSLKGMEPIESVEGGTLFYVVPGTTDLWSVPVAGGEPRKAIAGGITRGWWTPVAGGICYADVTRMDMPDEPAHPPVLWFDFASRTSRVIGELPMKPNIQQPGLTVTGDDLWTDWTEFSAINLIRGELRM